MDTKSDTAKKLEFKGVCMEFDGTPFRPPPIPIRPNVRAALDYLDTILSRGGQDAQDLWDILTALRGPDEHHYDDEVDHKKTVTIPVRLAALPRTACAVRSERASGDYYSSRITPGVCRRASFGAPSSSYRYAGPQREGPGHFEAHAYRAARALGLI